MFHIRPSNFADMDILRQIYREAAESSEGLPSIASGHISFDDAIREETIHVACDEDGRVVGFVGVFEPDSFIHHLYVAPKSQRQGIGRALLNSLRSWLPSPWRLKCVAANVGALRFYENLGWEPIDEGSGPDGPYVLLTKHI